MALATPSFCWGRFVHACESPRWQRFAQFITRNRVPISVCLFVVMMIEDIVAGFKPHDVVDLTDPYSSIGLLLIIAGLALRSWSAGILHKSVRLTTSGPYGVMRNPLYVGSFAMMVGFCIVIDDPENIWIVLGPILLMYFLKVRQEERKLAGRFGLSWQEYARATPRFLPRRFPRDGFADWQFVQWRKNREYHAVISAASGILALKLWQIW
jgi:protein-S-isoprenylcysteine O-methyltransferase Ste14